MTVILGKEREVRMGDRIMCLAYRYSGYGTVTRVTAKYIWLEYTSPVDEKLHTIKRNRDIVLLGTKHY